MIHAAPSRLWYILQRPCKCGNVTVEADNPQLRRLLLQGYRIIGQRNQ